MPIAVKEHHNDGSMAYSSSPGGNLSAAVTNDVAFGFIARGLYVGGAGDVTLVKPNGTALVFKSVPAGTVLPQACIQVNSSGTTATNIVAFGN